MGYSYSQEEIIIMDCKDDVGIIKREVNEGEKIIIKDMNYKNSIEVKVKIPFGFKIALKDINIGEKIYKGGEIIGKAKMNIQKGEMVHVHNIEGLRGRGDLKKK
jgi:altronate dehydratase small subunit